MFFKISSKEEEKTWVRAINRNAGLLSAAPLSAGVGSQLKFQRPLLPSACSTLPLVSCISSVKRNFKIISLTIEVWSLV